MALCASVWFLVGGRCVEAPSQRYADRPRVAGRSNSLARSSTHFVTSVSAGPPFVGLYLKPPSSGGLCEGVTTMPSARCFSRLRL